MADPLRIGLMLDGELAPAWIVRVLERVASIPGLEIALVLTSSDVAATAPEDVGDWDGASSAIGWKIWRAFERVLYARHASFFELRPLPERLRLVSRLTIPSGTSASAIPMSMLKHLRSLGLDVLIQFGLPEWGPPLCGVARLGVWRIRSGDRRHGRRGPPGYWEVVNSEGSTAACLEMLRPESLDGKVLAEGAFMSERRSVLGNRSAHYGAACGMLVRELESLQLRGAEAWLAHVESRQAGVVSYGGRGGVRSPTLTNAVLGALRVYGRRVFLRLRSLFMREQWHLLFFFGAGHVPDLGIERFKRIVPPKDRSWADPFVVSRNGRWFVFFEEKLHNAARGVIACLELRADGGWTEPRYVLERPYHLSYPNVFEHEGGWYMVPETHEAGRVELYRALEFPWRWTLVRTLIDGVVLADPTLWRMDGRWWLFGTVRTHEDMLLQDGLHIFSTDDLLNGEWVPHADNPVVLDATSARPAGRLWMQEGKVMRPSQDCTFRYGYALRVNEVDVLSADEFRERCVRHLLPARAKSLVGVHTLTHSDGVTVIDGLQWRWR